MSTAVDGDRVVAQLAELNSLTGDERGAQRVAWTPVWIRALEWFEAELARIPGVESDRDEAGNVCATLPGQSATALLIGSHLDSVPDGGGFDGAYGVVAGLEVLRALAAGPPPPVTVTLVAWADEEGVSFGRSLFGSAAVAGTLDVAALKTRHDRAGRPAADVLADCDVDLDRVSAARRRLTGVAAYLELHIEQGPVLEDLGLPLAAVTGTLGVERHLIRYTGQSSHAGATPMELRRDPLAAAARLVTAIRSVAVDHGGLATCGSLKTVPGIPTAVAAVAELTLDARDSDAARLAAMYDAIQDVSEEIAKAERVHVEWERLWNIAPVLFDGELTELAAATVARISGTRHTMPSGPLHDAVEMARAGIPTAMLFVPSIAGLSHTQSENSFPAHLSLGVTALADLTDEVIRHIFGH